MWMWKRIHVVYLEMVRIWPLDNDDDNCYFVGGVLTDEYFGILSITSGLWVGLAKKENPSVTCDSRLAGMPIIGLHVFGNLHMTILPIYGFLY